MHTEVDGISIDIEYCAVCQHHLSCCIMLCWVMYIMWFRLFHVDDIPSGVGGDTLDFNKATEVGW